MGRQGCLGNETRREECPAKVAPCVKLRETQSEQSKEQGACKK